LAFASRHRPTELGALTNLATVVARQSDPDMSNNTSPLEPTVTTH
jgi:hypothetical protein